MTSWVLGSYFLINFFILLFVILILIPWIRWYRQKRMTTKQPPSLIGFEKTNEIFVDPTTGIKQQVWYNPKSGERYYETIDYNDE